MSLPKINYPISSMHFASIGRDVNYRPMTSGDEKLLLMAKQSNSDNDVFSAVKQIVNNCILDKKFNIDDLPLYELEWAFIRLRIESIGNSIDLVFKDSEDGHEYTFAINLEDIKIKYPTNEAMINNKISISDDVGVVMRHPPASLYDNKDFLDTTDVSKISEELMLSSIREVWDAEDSYLWKDFPKEEQSEFLNSIPSQTYREMQKFIANTPTVEHIIKYKNKSGTERTITLRTLNDFFIL